MNLEELRARKGFICDMDGVIYLGNQLLPGVREFVSWLNENGNKFLLLKNSTESSPKELRQKLQRMGQDIDEEHFYTSALATAAFLKKQAPGCTAFVIGAPGLLNALYDVGVTMNDVDPDYVIVGETASYNYEVITKAVRLVLNGARLIATNSDLTGPTEFGIAPACRSLVAPIELATGKKAYFMGKPNPLMMRTGLHLLGVHSEEAAMVGDRMDTDVISGMESGMSTVLVLSGVSTRETLKTYAYRPSIVLDGVGDIAAGVASDAIGSVLAEQAADAAEAELRQWAAEQDKYLTGRFSPGYGDWPISLQPLLAETLDTARQIGLYVTDTYLMTPRKSVTALLGVSDHPVRGQLAGCGHCVLRARCNYRKRGITCAEQ